MEDEPPARLDRATMMHSAIRRLARIDFELAKQGPEANARPLMTNPDSDRAILIVDAQGNHRPLEARIGHSRHRQQQFAGQKRGRLRHKGTMGRQAAPGNT
jgi:hypothetical protein